MGRGNLHSALRDQLQFDRWRRRMGDVRVRKNERGGEQAHTLSIAEVPQHTHTVAASTSATGGTATPNGNYLGGGNNVYLAPAGGTLTSMHPDTVTNTGGSQAHLNMQPFLTLNACIALQGIFPSRN